MKKNIILTLFIFIACINMAQSQNKINITIDGKTMAATLADNAATKALVEKLTEGPFTISMRNYGGFEKVGELPWTLPSSDTRITTKPGDIMLYTGDNMVIFYGNNTWEYTPLGTLETDDPAEISDFVGDGPKEVTVSLAGSSAVHEMSIDAAREHRVFSLDGKEIRNRDLSPGFYIIDNKKVRIK